MSRDLPFPIAFVLPQGWTSVPPDSCGQPDAAFVALRDDAPGPVKTNFVVSGLGAHDVRVDVAAMAAQHLTTLRAQYPVIVLRREASEGPSAHAAQLLQIEYPAGGSTVPLKQIQILNVFPGIDPDTVAILEFVLTCPDEIFESAGREFTQFVASITSQYPGQ